jgi:hypothetical protein
MEPFWQCLPLSLSSYYILNIYPFYFEGGKHGEGKGGVQRHYDNYCGSSLSCCALLLSTNYLTPLPIKVSFFQFYYHNKKYIWPKKFAYLHGWVQIHFYPMSTPKNERRMCLKKLKYNNKCLSYVPNGVKEASKLALKSTIWSKP